MKISGNIIKELKAFVTNKCEDLLTKALKKVGILEINPLVFRQNVNIQVEENKKPLNISKGCVLPSVIRKLASEGQQQDLVNKIGFLLPTGNSH